MTKPFKITLIFVGVFVGVVLLYATYLVATYIDDTVEKGEAYGFKIADSKEETYKRAKEVFKNKKVFILYPLDKQEYGPHKKITFSAEDYQMIDSRDLWEFFFNEDFNDSLTLSFQDDSLVKIYRHRQNFELP